MKLKPVVASLVMLGLMTPAFGHSVSQQAAIDNNSIVAKPCPEWFKSIKVGGLGSVVGIMGNHDPAGTFTSKNSGNDLYINNLNLLINAELSSWSKATVNLAYFGAPQMWQTESDDSKTCDGYIANRTINHGVVVDEAYVTISNLAKYPFYMVFGKKYVPFGDYSDPYAPIQIMSPAQMLAQTNAITAVAGVTTDFGFYANLFAFRGETAPVNSDTGKIRNYGAKIGYYNDLANFNAPNTHINFALGYIRNLWDSQVFSPNADPQHGWGSSNYKASHPATKYEIDPVGGVSAHFDLSYKSFGMAANFVSAMKDMVNKDYSPNHHDDSNFWGADVSADYAFKTMNHDSKVTAGVQWSGNGQWMADNYITDWARVVPKWRLLAEYKVNLFKHTDLSLVAAHGKSYEFPTAECSVDHGARTTNVGLARLNFTI